MTGLPPKRPRLAYVVHSLDTGGTERLVVDMSRAVSDNYDVRIFCLDQPGRWARELRNAGIPVYCVWRQPGFDIGVGWRLARLCRGQNVALMHAHQAGPWFYAALARVFHRGPRLLFEEHGRFYPEADSLLRRFVNRALISRLTHRVVAVSEDVRRRLVRYEGLPSDRIEVVYNGVKPAHSLDGPARRELRHQLGFSDDHIVVGSVGRLDEIKNFPMLIDAIAATRNRIPQVRGLIVGDGPQRASLESHIMAVGQCDSIVLTGFRDDARALTACLDVFVLPSFSEGTSMALLEAMAAGIPVVVTDVGGNPEVVQEGVSGRIVPSGDTGRLVQSIRELLEDQQSRKRLGDAAQLRFEDCFSFDAMLKRYREIYLELLDSGVIA